MCEALGSITSNDRKGMGGGKEGESERTETEKDPVVLNSLQQIKTSDCLMFGARSVTLQKGTED
jgi:hypothetical protein